MVGGLVVGIFGNVDDVVSYGVYIGFVGGEEGGVWVVEVHWDVEVLVGVEGDVGVHGVG